MLYSTLAVVAVLAPLTAFKVQQRRFVRQMMLPVSNGIIYLQVVALLSLTDMVRAFVCFTITAGFAALAWRDQTRIRGL